MFQFATSTTDTLFDGYYYHQENGVAIGSPLCPVLGNLFMVCHVKNWLKEFAQAGVILYKRYVDDKVSIFDCESEAKNIRFTFEKEQTQKVSFLDVLTKDETGIQTSVYR